MGGGKGGHEAVGAMGHGTNEARSRGAGRAEGAGTIWSAMEREGRRGRSGKGGGGGKGGKGGGAGRAERAGMHWDPLKSAERVPR